MKIDTLVRFGAMAMLAAPLALGACGGGTECGTGTEEVDGTCVAVCAAGTAFNETTGQCDPDEASFCGENTTFDTTTGSCLPDYDVLCPTGQVWDATAGACSLPTPTVAEGAEPNDPRVGGTAISFDLPAENETVVLGGSILTASDVNGDDTLDADYDGFEFAATAGQVIQLEGTSGPDMPSVAFVVVSAAALEGGETNAISHFGIAASGRNPVRTIRFVESGNYVILVSEKANVVKGDTVGGANMTYAVAVTLLPTPADQTVALGAVATAGFEDGVVYNVTGVTAGDLLEFAVADADSSVLRTLYVLDAEGNVTGKASDSWDSWGMYFYPIGTTRMLGVRFYLDYSYNLSTFTSSDVTVSKVPVVDVGTLTMAAPLSSASHSLTSATQTDTYKFSYTAGTDDAMTTIAINDRSPDFQPLIILRDDTYTIISYATDTTTLDQLNLASGTYYVDVAANEDTFAGPYTYSIAISVAVITNVTAETSADNNTCTTAGAVNLAPLPALINGTFTASDDDYYAITGAGATITFTAAGDGDNVIGLYAADCTTVLASADNYYAGPAESFSYTLDNGVTYYFVISEFDGATGNYQVLISE